MSFDIDRIKSISKAITAAIPGEALDHNPKDVAMSLGVMLVALCDSLGLTSEQGQWDLLCEARRTASLVLDIVDHETDS